MMERILEAMLLLHKVGNLESLEYFAIEGDLILAIHAGGLNSECRGVYHALAYNMAETDVPVIWERESTDYNEAWRLLTDYQAHLLELVR